MVRAIRGYRLFQGYRGHPPADVAAIEDVLLRISHLALEVPEAAGQVFNIGSGEHYTMKELGQRMAAVMGKEYIEPEITGKYRMGDIRHCFADITRARKILGYDPHVTLEEGLGELVSWLEGQVAVDRVAEASAGLSARGLTV